MTFFSLPFMGENESPALTGPRFALIHRSSPFIDSSMSLNEEVANENHHNGDWMNWYQRQSAFGAKKHQSTVLERIDVKYTCFVDQI